MNIKICLPPRKRPMTLDDLPDMSALVPVGSWQQVVAYGAEEWTVGMIESAPHKPYDNSAERERTADGWGEWRIGESFTASLAKFEIEAPWTLEELEALDGNWHAVVFRYDSKGFRVEDATEVTPHYGSISSALDWAKNECPVLIINTVTRERVLEVTP